MLLVNSTLSPRPVLDGSVEHEGAVGLQDLEGAGVVCLPRKVFEVRGVETLARDCLVDRDQRHALLGDVVHVPKSEYSGLALGGGNKVIDVATPDEVMVSP